MTEEEIKAIVTAAVASAVAPLVAKIDTMQGGMAAMTVQLRDALTEETETVNTDTLFLDRFNKRTLLLSAAQLCKTDVAPTDTDIEIAAKIAKAKGVPAQDSLDAAYAFAAGIVAAGKTTSKSTGVSATQSTTGSPPARTSFSYAFDSDKHEVK